MITWIEAHDRRICRLAVDLDRFDAWSRDVLPVRGSQCGRFYGEKS
jgi:hypothetical protein